MKKASEKKQSVRSSSVEVKEQNLQEDTEKGKTGIKKQYLKSNGWCNVTFTLPKDAAPDARVVNLVGDFNEWNLTETEMKKLKSGDFKVTLKLHKNKEYRFRYLIDSKRWENDWSADEYVPNLFGCEDSLVIV